MENTGIQQLDGLGVRKGGAALMVNGALISVGGSGSRRVPSNVYTLAIEIWGGGGYNISNPRDGGGAGGYSKRNAKAVTPGATIPYTVGQRTLGVTASTCDSMTANNGALFTSSGGTASGGDVNTTGGSGATAAGSNGGTGGTAPNGGAGGAGAIEPGNAGNAVAPGGGGGGSSVSGFGSDGANGGVKFSWTEELLETFENTVANPANGATNVPADLAWTMSPAGGGPGTYSRQTTYVTQGTYSGYLGVSDGGYGIKMVNNADLSGYTSFKLDVKQRTTASGVCLRLTITDGTNTEYVDSTANSTSAQTLTLTPTTVNKSACKLWITSTDPSSNGASIDFDNLRGVI